MTVSRALLLFGTGEPAPPPRLLRAGALSAELDAGTLRAIRFGGAEMIRAIAFLVRSRVWATYAPDIADLSVREDADRFDVTYHATIRDGAAALTYHVHIEGRSDGTLSFAADAVAQTEFATCRTGFVVLHPIVGVAGAPVEIEHADGSRQDGHFPALIDPVQPMKNLRALTHSFAPGARVTCRMEGDVFEMEDQRNWTDASFKTYSRPLALPWPFILAAGQSVRQAVRLSVAGAAPSAGADPAVRIALGDAAGPMPPLALGCNPDEAEAALPHAARLRAVGIPTLVCRFDPRRGHDAAALGPVRALAAAIGAGVELQVVVPSLDAVAADLAAAAAAIAQAGMVPAAVTVLPAADLVSTPPGSVWPPAPPAAAVLHAARAAFPGIPLGGGMVTHFTELNRKRPPLDLIDFVTFATTPIVHAADDRAVMESLEALPAIAASARALAGGLAFRVGPSAIGMRDNPNGPAALANPDGIRLAMAGRDPRQGALFNAAWTLGHIARFAHGGAARIAVAAPLGDFGILTATGACPVFHVIRGLASLRGSVMRAVAVSDEHDVLALQAGDELWVANLTGAARTVVLPAAYAQGGAAILDAGCGPDWDAMRKVMPAAQHSLDAYAVARFTLTD